MPQLKRLFAGLLALLFVAVLAADSALVGAAHAQAAPDSVLRIAVVLKPIEDRFRFKGGITPYETNIFETLVLLQPDMKMAPGLATSWERRGETTWRFHLRKGVRFHSGRAFDAASVKLSLETSIRELRLLGLTRIKSITVVDAHTVDIETTMPFAGLPEALSHPITSIGNLEQTGPLRPDGTGPFRHVSHVVDVELVVDRNPGYWGPPAKVGRIVFRIVTDPMTRLLALRRGEVDFIQSVSFGSIDSLERDAKFQVHKAVSSTVQVLWFNRLKPPVDDVRVRQAIAHAVDRKAIVDFVLLGIGEEAPAHIPPHMPWSIRDETKGHVFDPERARRLLSEAGWTATGRDGILVKDGKRLEVEMSMHLLLGPQAMSLAEAVQAMLKAVGVSMKLVVLERGAYFEARDRGDHQMSLGGNLIASASGEFLLHQAHKDSSANRIARVLWIGPHVDALIDEAAGTFDQERRFDLYRQVQRIWEAEAFSVPIYYAVGVDASARHVHGFVKHATTWSQRWDMVEIRR